MVSTGAGIICRIWRMLSNIWRQLSGSHFACFTEASASNGDLSSILILALCLLGDCATREARSRLVGVRSPGKHVGEGPARSGLDSTLICFLLWRGLRFDVVGASCSILISGTVDLMGTAVEELNPLFSPLAVEVFRSRLALRLTCCCLTKLRVFFGEKYGDLVS